MTPLLFYLFYLVYIIFILYALKNPRHAEGFIPWQQALSIVPI